ncbi:unnamed protein product [Ostreobium quekettii]|uniref:TPX2 C-terminal domain-containing protein n=1 Tax=Ostreobium quekettii TaxID=121088 RepID=A0A8S1JFX1_9CHLO|nr:unnamed protein product [Ostreobium quekettii]
MPSAAPAASSSAEEEVQEMRSSKTPDATSARSSSTRSSPVTATKPFHFKSEERRRKALENNQNKGNSAGRLKVPENEEDAKKLAAVKVQRAREYAQNWAPRSEPQAGKSVTVPKSPRFTVEARIQYHHEVLEPKKKMKEAAMERERRREQRRKEEEEERKLREYRRTLVPKARAMPSFVGPVFQPDYTSAQPTTKAKEPRLVTSARFGARQTSPKGPPPHTMRCRSPMRDVPNASPLQQFHGAKSQLPPAPYSASNSSGSLPDENQENEAGDGEGVGATAAPGERFYDPKTQERTAGSPGGSAIPSVPRNDNGAEDMQMSS